MNRRLSRSEKLLLLLLGIALIGVIIKWKSVKQGIVKGWEHYNIEQWFSRD